MKYCDWFEGWVNPEHECKCHQASGDSANCRYHYTAEDRTKPWPHGVRYASRLRLIVGGAK